MAYEPKMKNNSSSGEFHLKKFLLLFLAGFTAWVYQETRPPPPMIAGSPNGPPVTTPRIKLRDGRYLSYIESGVPKDSAKSKIIFAHCFDCTKYMNPFATAASPALIEELGVYTVAFDRPGYGESDPDPRRTGKSIALDIEELADQLELGSKFYVAGFSMGGQVIWSCLEYIPHRLEGAVLIAPAVNYWWPRLPSNLSREAYSRQLVQDQWSMRVAHYLPWLTYWWNTRTWIPSFSVIEGNTAIYSAPDMEVLSNLTAAGPDPYHVAQSTQQGEFESIHRDLNIGFGKAEFDPVDVQNPFPNNQGSVHLWMGVDDLIVPVTLQRYIVKQLPWIKYHEVTNAGHLLAFADGKADSILRALFDHMD